MLVLVAVLIAACSNTPPPPVVTSPAASTSVVPPPKTPSQIVVGVDDIVGGYNPHNLADASTVTTALAQLLLPSVFRENNDGTPTLDTNLMVSASITSEQPFSVAYEIRQDASWSDGAPIAAEDFIYLANAMKDNPGVVEPAGYRLISDIQSRQGGKRVEVTFSKPYPGWQTLFSDLLPVHLLKDAPGGWNSALASSFPAYGGPFSIQTIDTARGEILLERNERYWVPEKTAAVDRLILRRTDRQSLGTALSSGNDQFVMARTDATGLQQLAALGKAVQLHTVPRPFDADVLLRPAGGVLADTQVRGAVAALLDRNKLITVGVAGGPSSTLHADAQVLPPSAKGYAATIPAGPPSSPDPAKAETLLKAAGYTKTAGTWRKAGKPLTLVVASPGQQEPYASIAKELTTELIAAGVTVTAVTPQPRDLFTSLLAIPVVPGQTQTATDPNGSVGADIAVVPQPVDGDPATILASTFGCRPDQAGADKTKPVVPSNSAALCDTSLQPTIDSAMTGSTSMSDALSTLEPALWKQNVVIPLFQLADTLAIGSGIAGLTPGPPMVGPFGGAATWTRTPTPPTSSSSTATPTTTPTTPTPPSS
jgi:ABC-type transport system substrate-binding protein